MKTYLMKGNEAIAEAAIKAGCKLFFGYPITPSSEIPEYMSKRLPKEGGEFVQAESEISAINMVFGAAGAGKRVMTASSSPGISLKQEGISYLSANQLPAVIINVVRAGPGLGGLGPSQADYFQATKGGGHGDYKLIVMAPSGVQEAADLVYDAFNLADMYRNPVVVLADGIIGQMMEPVTYKTGEMKNLPPKDWATTGCEGRSRNIVSSYALVSEEFEKRLLEIEKKYNRIKQNEQRWESYYTDDAEYVIVAYGTAGRIAKSTVMEARELGIKLGLIRPITLWPFPENAFEPIIDQVKGFLTVEMSLGQLVEDVKLVVNGRVPVYLHRRLGGMLPTPGGILEKVKQYFLK